MKDQRIGVVDKQLNYFRWHPESVRVAESNKSTEFVEGIHIKKWMEQNFNIGSSKMFQARRDIYLAYFKALKSGKISKNHADFLKVWSFINPLDKLKSLLRYISV